MHNKPALHNCVLNSFIAFDIPYLKIQFMSEKLRLHKSQVVTDFDQWGRIYGIN